MRSFCRKNHVRKIPLFCGGFWGGGGSADFIFMGARIFLICSRLGRQQQLQTDFQSCKWVDSRETWGLTRFTPCVAISAFATLRCRGAAPFSQDGGTHYGWLNQSDEYKHKAWNARWQLGRKAKRDIFGPVIFYTFLLELIAVGLIPVIRPARRGKAWKLLETIINSRQGLSRNKISNFSEINSWKHFSWSAIILVPTVIPPDLF